MPRSLQNSSLLAALLTFAIGCNQTSTPSSVDGGQATVGKDAAAAGAVHDAAVDASAADDAGSVSCSSDADCSDGVTCNGAEHCVKGLCRHGAPLACPIEHPCSERLRGCDCSNPNIDGDAFDAVVCGGEDCDDRNRTINPAAIEVCDVAGVDEDCNPKTFHDERKGTRDGDQDGDGYVSSECFNVDAATGKRYAGDDCHDNNPSIHPFNTEVCDYQDNDCNGVIDEAPAANGAPSGIAGSLKLDFYPDFDDDGCGDQHAKAKRFCEYTQPPGYVPGKPCDCDDTRANVHKGAPEVCDGIDNDCDGLIDDADKNQSPLVGRPDFTGTVVTCGGTRGWFIKDGDCPADLLWCSSTIDQGCTTRATQLTTCRACNTACGFACGQKGCDEVAKIASGENFSCATTQEGSAACWGRGALGRLGNDGTRSLSVPSQVTGLTGVTQIAAGFDSACAIAGANGDVFCWGNNANNQLGNSDPGAGSSAVALPALDPSGANNLSGATSVAVGDQFACATLTTGELACWGSEANGRLGDGNSANTTSFPVLAVDDSFVTVEDAKLVSAGARHACIITSANALECWGNNANGRLGDPGLNATESSTLHLVPNLGPVTAVSAGTNHTCAVSGGMVLCWGLNQHGQLGRASGAGDGTPAAVAGLSHVIAVGAGATFTCALGDAGSVYCWGGNGQGERGDLNPHDSTTPSQVPVERVVALSVGAQHACAVDDMNAVRCWGFNFFGQLGTGASSSQAEPVPQLIRPLQRN